MKKILAVFLIILIACTVFAKGASEASATGEKKAGTKNALLGPGNVTIKSVYQNVTFDPNTDLMAGLIEKSTGYKAEYFTLPAQNADEKLALEVASGVNYDIIRCSRSQFNMLLASNALMPLNDLLDEYGQDIIAGYTQETWDAVSDKNKVIYGIPYKYAADKEVASFIVCRKDLMKKAGITEMPITLDEFYNTLVTLKKYYGNRYIILTGPYLPATEKNENWKFPKVIASAFGIWGEWMTDENGKVIYMTEAKGFKPMLEFMNKLYNEGLLDPDWAVSTNDSVAEKFSSGRAIMACSSRTGCTTMSPAVIKNVGITYDDLSYISPLEGKDGTCTYMMTEAISSISVIPKSCKHPADVINWCHLKLQDQLYLNFGIEGTHFTYDADGNMTPNNPLFANERGNSYWYCNAMDMAKYQKDWPARIRKSEAQWQCWKGTTIATVNSRDHVFVDNPFKFMTAQENYSKFNSALHTSLNDFVVQVICGSKTVDNINMLEKDLTANNLNQVRAELQAYLAAK